MSCILLYYTKSVHAKSVLTSPFVPSLTPPAAASWLLGLILGSKAADHHVTIWWLYGGYMVAIWWLYERL